MFTTLRAELDHSSSNLETPYLTIWIITALSPNTL